MGINEARHDRVAVPAHDGVGGNVCVPNRDILDVAVRHDDGTYVGSGSARRRAGWGGSLIQHVSGGSDDASIDDEISLSWGRGFRAAKSRDKNYRRKDSQVGHDRLLCHRSHRAGWGPTRLPSYV